MAAIARPGASEDEVIASMIALSEVMQQKSAQPRTLRQQMVSIEDAIRNPATPQGERTVLVQLLQQLKEEVNRPTE